MLHDMLVTCSNLVWTHCVVAQPCCSDLPYSQHCLCSRFSPVRMPDLKTMQVLLCCAGQHWLASKALHRGFVKLCCAVCCVKTLQVLLCCAHGLQNWCSEQHDWNRGMCDWAQTCALDILSTLRAVICFVNVGTSALLSWSQRSAHNRQLLAAGSPRLLSCQ